MKNKKGRLKTRRPLNGCIQFIPSESLSEWLSDKPPHGVDWLSDTELVDRMDRLVADRSEARRHGDEGQFSLPGAQAKTGLYLDTENQRWGIPKGATPTTHILKPNVGEFEDFEINEHFCLKYDRLPVNGRLLRVHQEDFCQAIG